jgi:hypothetical protein
MTCIVSLRRSPEMSSAVKALYGIVLVWFGFAMAWQNMETYGNGRARL